MQFTVCVLLYGDHPDLAERVLSSLSRSAWYGKFQLRVGLNDLSNRSASVVSKYADPVFPGVTYYRGQGPFYKYPLMRRMLHEQLVTTPYTLWFDDDSWVAHTAPDDWFEQVAVCMVAKQLHIAGAPYFMHLRGNQHLWIEDQPWYAGRAVAHKHKVDFITGGWLALRTELLYRFNWPVPDIIHNGGDVMLGALCQQQGLRIGKFVNHLGINANKTGKCSSAIRRGASLTPVGVDYVRQSAFAVPGTEKVTENDWLNLFDGRDI